MNDFNEGDPVYVNKYKEHGIVEYCEKNKVIVLLINGKTVQCQSFECELLEDDEIEVDCECCDGSGIIEIMKCRNNSNECCGGCFESVNCDECNGNGKLMKDIFEII